MAFAYLSSSSLLPITICEPGCSQKRWFVCLCPPSPGTSFVTSSFHSINCPPNPIFGPESLFIAVSISAISGSLSLPNTLLAFIIISNISAIIACEVEQPNENSPCSGECEGFATKVPSRSSVQRLSTQKRAAWSMTS